MNLQAFFTGQSFDAYRYFGAHFENNTWVFRVYAPQALSVSLFGTFNDWTPIKMKKVHPGGVYEVTYQDAKVGDLYKYRIVGKDGRTLDRMDPYGFSSELRPGTASCLARFDHFLFHDDEWLKRQTRHFQEPLNIYEVHAAGFKRHEDGSVMNYRELATELIPYLKEMGYTHVEFLPLAEHPSDESWGYQITGFYSVTSRYGTPEDFMAMVDMFHQNHIGVFMDVVTAHFAVNDFALYRFDGTALYEYDHRDIGESEWGSYNFNFYRPDVCSFLQSSYAFWLDQYHIDGLRFDAIANLLYWQGKKSRGENEGAIRFIKTMNEGLHKAFPNAILMAEDSTSYVKVTAPVRYDGLGFDYKWDLGWMNDTLRFFMTNPDERAASMSLLTFSMMYYFQELYLLPFSHDEVVHGKKTMVDKMPGSYEEKFRNARLMYLYMMTHPGKKLNFMGNELGMFREFDEKRELDWVLKLYPMHHAFSRYFRDLCHIYRYHDAFYTLDFHTHAYLQRFLEAGIYSFERLGKDEDILVVFNFTNTPRKLKYTDSVEMEEILNTMWSIYEAGDECQAETIKANDFIDLPALTGRLFVVKGKKRHGNAPIFTKTW